MTNQQTDNSIKICGKTVLIVAVLFFSLSYFLVAAHARTIALVYDDSGSMQGKDKWVYANYAAQSLIALLQQDDEFYVVKMSNPKNLKNLNIRHQKKECIKKVRKNWEYGGIHHIRLLLQLHKK